MVYKFEGGIKFSKKVSKVKVNEVFNLLYNPEMKKHLKAEHEHILISLDLRLGLWLITKMGLDITQLYHHHKLFKWFKA